MKRIISLLITLVITLNLFAWGAKGHDVVAYVAEQHLTKKAKKEITKILDGKSMVYYANWADNSRYTDEYAYTKTWHYLNINDGESIDNFKRNPKGDVESAIRLLVAQLTADTLSPKKEADAIKLLVHFVGDIHCPMHLAKGTDRGGNTVAVKFFREKSNLHRIWDSQLLEAAHKWSYTEWQKQIDILNPKQIKTIQLSKPIDWAEESYIIAKQVYVEIPEGSNVSYDEINKYAPTIENQLLKAGYRLAALLNEIYG